MSKILFVAISVTLVFIVAGASAGARPMSEQELESTTGLWFAVNEICDPQSGSECDWTPMVHDDVANCDQLTIPGSGNICQKANGTHCGDTLLELPLKHDQCAGDWLEVYECYFELIGDYCTLRKKHYCNTVVIGSIVNCSCNAGTSPSDIYEQGSRDVCYDEYVGW